ncbi:MAG: hypothetical protein Q9210_003547, partial [Variospora velana]
MQSRESPNPPKWAFANLAHNGWKTDDRDGPPPRRLYPCALAAIKAKGMSTEEGKNVERTANLENSFVNAEAGGGEE